MSIAAVAHYCYTQEAALTGLPAVRHRARPLPAEVSRQVQGFKNRTMARTHLGDRPRCLSRLNLVPPPLRDSRALAFKSRENP